MAALPLIGCGSSSGNKAGGSAQTSSLVSVPQDSTSKATKGGIYATSIVADVTSLDAIGGGTNTAAINQTEATMVYPFIVRNKMVKYPDLFTGDIEPDVAASWEISQDGLQYTFKMRPNQKLDPRAPTNGRVLDASDVKFSWDYFVSDSQSRTNLSHATAPDAPIDSLTTPDNQTIVVKLAFPYAALLPMLAYTRHLPIMPKEAAGGPGGFDKRSEIRGSGAFRLDQYTRSASLKFRKNPDWYDADKIYLDGVDVYIIPEYATRLAQLRAGNLWSITAVGAGTTGNGVLAEDVLQTKRDLPSLTMLPDEGFTRTVTPWVGFSAQPGSPFLDQRVRQAVSRLVDRDLWIDTFYNVENFIKEGLPVQTRWNSHISAGEEGYWLDPKGKEIGPDGVNFQYNPAEAKKLLSAAGYTTTIQSLFNYPVNAYAQPFMNEAQALIGMLEAHGDFKFRVVNPDYQTDWLTNYHYGNGRYEGLAQGSANTYPEVDGHLQAYFHDGTSRVWHGYPDRQLNTIIDQQRQELDRNKRIGFIKEFQRYCAKTMPAMIAPGAALGFTLRAGWVGNAGLWRGAGGTQQVFMDLWYDKSKAKS